MRATKEAIQSLFRRFNVLCFRGELPEIRMETGNLVKKLGMFQYPRRRSLLRPSDPSGCLIKISSRYDFEEDQLGDVIIHEMIHYYIWYRRLHDTGSHGEVFRRIMSVINEIHGRHVTVRAGRMSESLLPARSARSAEMYFVCVTEWNDGAQCLTVAARTRIGEICEMFKAFGRVRSFRWYMTSDPWFSSFPRSIKAKAYHVDPTSLCRHLTGATEIDTLRYDPASR